MADTDDSVTAETLEEQIERNRQNGWLDLTPEDRGLAIAFVECSYSVKETADHLGVGQAKVRSRIRKPLVAAYIGQLQDEDYSTVIATKQFVTTSMMRMLPKLAGEEEVPMMHKGEQLYGYHFHAAELRSVLQYLGDQHDKQGKGTMTVQWDGEAPQRIEIVAGGSSSTEN